MAKKVTGIIKLQIPDSGSVVICGEDIADIDMKDLNEVRKKIGFLFQQGALYDSMSLEENVAFPLTRHTSMAPGDRQRHARELLAGVGLEKDFAKTPSQLSGGMQKRAALARALALDPEILLFDEPTSGLDPITAEEISHLIVELKQKRAISAVVVTHDVHLAKIISDRMVLLHEGKIHAEGTYAELEKSEDKIVLQFLGDLCRR